MWIYHELGRVVHNLRGRFARLIQRIITAISDLKPSLIISKHWGGGAYKGVQNSIYNHMATLILTTQAIIVNNAMELLGEFVTVFGNKQNV